MGVFSTLLHLFYLFPLRVGQVNILETYSTRKLYFRVLLSLCYRLAAHIIGAAYAVCGYSSVAEPQLPKLIMRVRFPLSAPRKKTLKL